MKLLNVKRKLLKSVLAGTSMASMLFVFQACYGVPHDEYDEGISITGVVTSHTTGRYLSDIKVTIEGDTTRYCTTDRRGTFSFYAPVKSEYLFHFTDVLENANVHFISKDTLITNPDVRKGIRINITLDEAQ